MKYSLNLLLTHTHELIYWVAEQLQRKRWRTAADASKHLWNLLRIPQLILAAVLFTPDDLNSRATRFTNHSAADRTIDVNTKMAAYNTGSSFCRGPFSIPGLLSLHPSSGQSPRTAMVALKCPPWYRAAADMAAPKAWPDPAALTMSGMAHSSAQSFRVSIHPPQYWSEPWRHHAIQQPWILYTSLLFK